MLASIQYQSITRTSDNVLRIIWSFILPISILMSVVFAVAISNQIRKPVNELSERVGSVDIENYEYAEKDYGVDVINRLGEQFEESFGKIKELIEKVYIAEIRQKNAQYEILQEQITPHFMYNSLQLIKTEALLAGNKEIGEITTSFSNLLRYSLEKDVKWVNVKQETENIVDYLNIYHKRFPQKFSYEINIDEKIQSRMVLKLILQPVVENCIKHGFRDITENGKIKVEGYEQGEDIWFRISDNGEGISRQRMEEIRQSLNDNGRTINTVGLINVHRRIVIEDGAGYGLVEIVSEQGKETIFTIKVRGNRYV